MTRIYTQEQHAWIADHYADMTNRELAAAFNERFGCDYATQDKMNNYGSQHRLRKSPETFARRMRKYTDEQLAWLRGYIPGHHEGEIIDAYEERFGERLTVSMVANLKVKLGVISGTDGGRWRRGREPPNKGKTWDELGYSPELQARMRRTCFKPGQKPHNAHHELLDEKRDRYGTWVFVRPRNRRFGADDWLSKARFVWMQANGRDWPEGHRSIIANGNHDHITADQVVAVPAELYPIVTGGAHGHALEWHDRETLELAITHAMVMHARCQLEKAPRACGVCGKEFRPYYPNQRTCRVCLDAGRRAPRKRRRREST